MAQYLSGRQKNTKVGVPGFSTDTTVLDVYGTTKVTGLVTATKLYVSGIATFSNLNAGNFSISSGIVTATSGVVTYYGDGSKLTGITGVGGTQGLQGIQGTQGIQGIQGLQGTQGLQGLQGTTGSGTQGLQGIQGTQGLQGIQGTQGLQGLQGTTGLGTQGLQGIQGTQGLQGLQGTTGSGTQGLQGLQGIQGTTGPVAGSANQVVYKDGSNNSTGSANLTFDGSKLTVVGIVSATSLSVSGISTLGTLQVSSGIVTATVGVITYYGDGSKLSGISTGGGGSSSISISINTTNQDQFIPFVTSTGTATGFGVSTTGLVFNPSTGNLGIGTTTPTSKLTVSGNLLVTGIITATDFNSASDINLKENVKKIDNPIDKIIKIDGVRFNWKSDNKPSMGVIAQNIEKVLPELVRGNDSKTVNYNGIIGLLIECVKNQQEQIDELNRRLDEMS